MSIPTHMWPSSVRISPERPDPHPTSRMNEGTSGLLSEMSLSGITVIQADLLLEGSIQSESKTGATATISACTCCIRELQSGIVQEGLTLMYISVLPYLHSTKYC